MRKIYIILLTILCLVLLPSCVDTPAETTAETTVTDKSAQTTTAAELTVASTTEITTGTTPAMTTTAPTETTAQTTSAANESTTETTLETLPDMFVELMEHPLDRGYFWKKSDITRFFPDPKSQYVGVHYRVIGYDEEFEIINKGSIVSRWYVEIIDVYGEERYEEANQIDYDKICTVAMRGIPTSTLYGIPVPTIGEDYFRYAPLSEVISGDIWVALYMDIEEVDGEKYLYGYGIDMSVFEGAIKITDAEENQIYNEKNHYKITAYLNKIGKSLPTFDYKIKVEDFLDELGIMEKD